MTHEGSAGPGLAEVDLEALAKLRSILLDMRAQLADIAATPKGMPLSEEMVQTCFAIFGFVHEHDIANLFPEEIPHSALRAATASQEGWQPIETAPEAEWLLVKVPNYGMNIASMTRDPNILGENGKFWFIRGELHRCRPTHWMPLPAAPQVAQEGQP